MIAGVPATTLVPVRARRADVSSPIASRSPTARCRRRSRYPPDRIRPSSWPISFSMVPRHQTGGRRSRTEPTALDCRVGAPTLPIDVRGLSLLEASVAGWPNLKYSESHFAQHGPFGRPTFLKALARTIQHQAQDFGDVLFAILHFQRLGVESAAMTGRARGVKRSAGTTTHHDETFPLAMFASTFSEIESRTAEGRIPLRWCQLRGGEQPGWIQHGAGVRRHVRFADYVRLALIDPYKSPNQLAATGRPPVSSGGRFQRIEILFVLSKVVPQELGDGSTSTWLTSGGFAGSRYASYGRRHGQRESVLTFCRLFCCLALWFTWLVANFTVPCE